MFALYLFDNNLNLAKVLDDEKIMSCTGEEEINGRNIINLESAYDQDLEKYLYFGIRNNDDFLIYRTINFKKGNNKISITGIHIFYEDFKFQVLRSVFFEKMDVLEILNEHFRVTGWEFACNKKIKYSNRFHYQTALECFYKLINDCNLEFKPTLIFEDGKIKKKIVECRNIIGQDKGKVFTYNDKLVSVVSETNVNEVCTAFIGRGKDKITFNDIDYQDFRGDIRVHSPIGCDYIEIKKNTEKWGLDKGRPRLCIIDFNHISDREQLAEATFEYALKNSLPKVHLKAKGILSKDVSLGEIVTIIGKQNIRYKTRIFKIKKDYLRDGLVEFEFGEKTSNVTVNNIKEVGDIKKNMELNNLDINSIIDEKIGNMIIKYDAENNIEIKGKDSIFKIDFKNKKTFFTE